MFAQGSFNNTAGMTPEQIERKRAYIAAMMPRFGSAKYVGEGLGQLATGVMIGRQNKKLDAAEGAGRASADKMFERIFGTANSAGSPDVQGPLSVLGMSPQAPDPASPLALGDDAMAALGKPPVRDYRESLIGTESGGNWAAQNSETGAGGKRGHFGRVQFGHARLQEAMDAGAIPQGITPEQFMASPDLQKAAEDWHFKDLEAQLSPLVGTVVNGQPMDIGALVAMGHLGGAEGAKRFVESGGQYNPSDSFGTSLADYAQKHGGTASPFGAAPGPASAPEIPINELYMALQNPWLSEEQKALVTTMIGEQQQASDPMRRLELRKAELELAQMENPEAQVPEDFATRMFTLNSLGIDPQTEEGKVYLMTGKLPEAADPGYRTLSPEEVTQMGLPPGAYQMGADGKIASIGGGGVNVNVDTGAGGQPQPQIGTIPQGFQAVWNAEKGTYEMQAIPGGPEDTAKTDAKKAGNADTASAVVTTAAERARAAAQERALGGFGQGIVAAINPYSDSAEVARQVDVLRANAKVDNLQAMRDASPTGGALGSVTEGETKMLADKSGALDPNSPNFERDLADYTRTLLRVVHGPEGGDRIFAETWKGPMPEGAMQSAAPSDQPATIGSDAEYDALPSGAIYIGPDGIKRRKP